MRVFFILVFIMLSSTRAVEKPNFVIIFTDDQGYADLSSFGGKHIEIPIIDKLISEGTKL